MADNTDFFKQEEQPEIPGTGAEMIKIGDREFTQEELGKRIGLSDMALEAEQKYNVKIDGVWPNLQRTINEKRELEQRLADFERNKVQEKTNRGEELSPAEMRKQALKEADELGLIHQGNVQQQVIDIVKGYQLLEKTGDYLEKQAQDGNPQTDTAKLLDYMNGNNPYGTRYGSYEKAYKDMFEPELEKIRETKLKSLKPQGFVTTERSSAGSKQPAFQKPNKDNLDELVKAALKGASFS